jgi:hypothetical protein
MVDGSHSEPNRNPRARGRRRRRSRFSVRTRAFKPLRALEFRCVAGQRHEIESLQHTDLEWPGYIYSVNVTNVLLKLLLVRVRFSLRTEKRSCIG